MPGNMEEVKNASRENFELTLLRKDFSGESFYRINLQNSTISKCIFIETKFFANKYESCDFIACDFSKADFLNINFKNCKFHECKFNETILQEVNFDNCSIMSCSFFNAKIENDVCGLDEKDLNIIQENIILSDDDFINIGFKKIDEDAFELTDEESERPELVKLVVTKDEESGKSVYRVMFFNNDDCIMSDTFDTEKIDKFETIKTLINSVFSIGCFKIECDDEKELELIKETCQKIKDLLK